MEIPRQATPPFRTVAVVLAREFLAENLRLLGAKLPLHSLRMTTPV